MNNKSCNSKVPIKKDILLYFTRFYIERVFSLNVLIIFKLMTKVIVIPFIHIVIFSVCMLNLLVRPDIYCKTETCLKFKTSSVICG